MLLYHLRGRKIVFTVHNVNKGERDGTDSFFNRVTLRVQYSLIDAFFVHTEKMSEALQKGFRVPAQKITVIPFPMNSTPPTTDMSSATARSKLNLGLDERVLLFYGHIAPYKGLHYLIQALSFLRRDEQYRLLIAGRIKVNAEKYWAEIQRTLDSLDLNSRVLARIEFVPDEETEIYFKAADALVLPYTYIFQSGVLFLGYNYGLPVLAADVGSLKEAIVEGETGFVFRPEDPEDLAKAVERFFESDLYRDLVNRRSRIREFASQRYSWSFVAATTERVYGEVLGSDSTRAVSAQQ
jgi:glycosyltransferase involved in cell wall biosynthesis